MRDCFVGLFWHLCSHCSCLIRFHLMHTRLTDRRSPAPGVGPSSGSGPSATSATAGSELQTLVAALRITVQPAGASSSVPEASQVSADSAAELHRLFPDEAALGPPAQRCLGQLLCTSLFLLRFIRKLVGLRGLTPAPRTGGRRTGEPEHRRLVLVCEALVPGLCRLLRVPQLNQQALAMLAVIVGW